jgi:uncharacterized membrane protein
MDRRNDMTTAKQEIIGQGSILIEAPIEAVYDLISDPETRWDLITPLEVHRQDDADLQAFSSNRYEMEIAGRTLRYESNITDRDRPGLVIRETRGDVNGTQTFRLDRRDEFTELTLTLTYAIQPEWPAYFREQPTAGRFAQTLVSQILEEIRILVEIEQVLGMEIPSMEVQPHVDVRI